MPIAPATPSAILTLQVMIGLQRSTIIMTSSAIMIVEIHIQQDAYNKYGDNTDILYQGDNLHLIYSDNKSEIDLKLLS